MRNEKVWASPTISVPPMKELGKGFCFKFPILKSMLSRNVCFFLMTRDESIPTSHQLPNVIVGKSEIVDLQLKTLLYSANEQSGQLPLRWLKTTRLYRAFEDVRGMLDINVKLQEQADLGKDDAVAAYEK